MPRTITQATLMILALLLANCNGFDQEDSVIYLIGDSTMADKAEDRRPETGWGEMLGTYFEERVRIENHARNGRSSRSFRDEGWWQVVLDKLVPGDYVFIQFGHNDAKQDSSRLSSPKEYTRNLGRFVEEARARGAKPVILTPVVRRRFNEQGEFFDTHGDYAPAARQAAAEYEAPLIDLHAKSEAVLRRLGETASEALFLWLKPGEHPNYPEGVEDNTHFSSEGASRMAALVAEGIAEEKLPLHRYLIQR